MSAPNQSPAIGETVSALLDVLRFGFKNGPHRWTELREPPPPPRGRFGSRVPLRGGHFRIYILGAGRVHSVRIIFYTNRIQKMYEELKWDSNIKRDSHRNPSEPLIPHNGPHCISRHTFAMITSPHRYDLCLLIASHRHTCLPLPYCLENVTAFVGLCIACISPALLSESIRFSYRCKRYVACPNHRLVVHLFRLPRATAMLCCLKIPQTLYCLP